MKIELLPLKVCSYTLILLHHVILFMSPVHLSFVERKPYFDINDIEE